MNSKLLKIFVKCLFWLGIFLCVFSFANFTESFYWFWDSFSLLAFGVGSLLLAPKFYLRIIDTEKNLKTQGI